MSLRRALRNVSRLTNYGGRVSGETRSLGEILRRGAAAIARMQDEAEGPIQLTTGELHGDS
jgi:hypothetical protein